MIGQWYIFTQHYCLFSISLWRQFSFLNISIDVPRPRHFHVHFAHDSFNSSALVNAKEHFFTPMLSSHTLCVTQSIMQHRAAYFPWYILEIFLLWNRCGDTQCYGSSQPAQVLSLCEQSPQRGSQLHLCFMWYKGVEKGVPFLCYVVLCVSFMREWCSMSDPLQSF